MLEALKIQILAELKNELGYSPAADSELDGRLKRYIELGAAKLNRTAGETIDFETDVAARGLLIDYCRYANSQKTEYFDGNFYQDLATLHAEYSVENFKKEDKNESESE